MIFLQIDTLSTSSIVSSFETIGIICTLVGFTLAVTSHYKNKTANKILKKIEELQIKAADDLKRIGELEESIADQTRKPLKSIEEVMLQCFNLANKASKKSNIIFVGITLAFGPAHETEEFKVNWKKDICMDHSDFETKYGEFHKDLIPLCSNKKSTIVCLQKDRVREMFLEKLYSNKTYKEFNNKDHLDNLENIIISKHQEIINSNNIKYIPNIPLQIFIADFNEPDGSKKRGCIVFHVGTENVSSGVVRGFYSTIPSVCDMFSDFAKSLAN